MQNLLIYKEPVMLTEAGGVRKSLQLLVLQVQVTKTMSEPSHFCVLQPGLSILNESQSLEIVCMLPPTSNFDRFTFQHF